MQESPSGSLYLVMAAVVLSRDRSGVEDRLRKALGRRRARIHWHNESPSVRHRLLDLVADEPIEAVCAITRPMTSRRQERARARALWGLVPVLEQRDVAELVFEARQEQLNARDRRTLGAVRLAGIGTEMTFRFALPSREEALLWAADVLAGAVALQEVSRDGRYAKRLPDGFITIIDVPG